MLCRITLLLLIARADRRLETGATTSLNMSALPDTMRAVQVKDYGSNFDDLISIRDDVATPLLGVDKPPSGFKDTDAMLIRVLAVALAPGDVRVMSGKTRKFQGPPSFPYTPGGDVCGIVVSLPKCDRKNKGKDNRVFNRFKVGDRVAARFVNKPMGMLGEYALVDANVCGAVPDGLSAEGAAALVSSGTVAVLIADKINEGDRVLIFGAGGGVGSHLCQLAKGRGASYVAGVGKDSQRLMETPLCCDAAVDYTKADPLTVKEWTETPFDIIIDLAGGTWPSLIRNSSIVKSSSKGGRYVTTCPDERIFELHSMWGIVKTFLFPPLYRALYTRYGLSRRSLPKYSYAMCLPVGDAGGDVITKTMKLASEKKLTPSIDEKGPFAFSDKAVAGAFRLMESYHSKGKVVITVSEV